MPIITNYLKHVTKAVGHGPVLELMIFQKAREKKTKRETLLVAGQLLQNFNPVGIDSKKRFILQIQSNVDLLK